MKFSTITKRGDAYRIFPGATFELHTDPNDRHSWILPTTGWIDRYWKGREPDANAGLQISNELLLSSDVLVRNYVKHDSVGACARSEFEITLLNAAIRLGDHPILVPEAKAAHCEAQVPAHAVWFATPAYPKQVELLSPKLVGRIFMSRLAVLTEGDALRANIVENRTREGTLFKSGDQYTSIVESFTVSFDGTNVRIDGVPTELPGQMCFA